MKLRKFKVSDLLIGLALIVVIAALVLSLIKQLNLKHEVSAAKITANRVIADIHDKKAGDAHGIATAAFQKGHSVQSLSSLFQAADNYAKGTPTIASQIVTNTKDSQNVGIVYKYTGSKNPYYIRIVATKPKSAPAWELASISGGNDQVKLENNQN